MYDQQYIDSRPTLQVAEVAKMRVKDRLKVKHFKSVNGCSVCACTMKTVSEVTKKIQCSGCLGQFKGLTLPYRKPTFNTIFNRGQNELKRKGLSVGALNARIHRAERATEYASRGNHPWIGVAFGGMNTVSK